MKLSRRSMFPLAAVGAVAAIDGSQGAALDPSMPGMMVRMARVGMGGWSVLVADVESMNGYWRPGMAVPTKWVPIQEYLTLIDETFAA